MDQLSHNVEGLEMEVERSKTKEVDTSQLLEAMQSDKVAAARALTQNKQLKEQLEELQSGFIIMVRVAQLLFQPILDFFLLHTFPYCFCGVA